MKFPLSWLKTYLDLPETPEKISNALTLAGIEVENMTGQGSDCIFEVSITPNLGHCLSIIGIVRELSALFNRQIKRHLVQFKEEGQDQTKKAISVAIKEPEGCFHYSCRLVRGVTVGPSPAWLRERLEACGIRSINNAVDIANFVMLESGHPLHLFDYDTLIHKQILVGLSQKEQTIKTLDEVERIVPKGTLLIYSGKQPIAIAGVIGGYDTAVTSHTRDILIESASFAPSFVRRASKCLALRTEASMRYERGVDRQETLSALERAVELLVQIAGATACQGAVDQVAKPYLPNTVHCRTSRVNRLLGTKLSQSEIASLLNRLEIKTLSESEDSLQMCIPSYRHDILTEIDLIEEVARIYGFNHIPKGTPRHVSSPISPNPLFLFEEEMREALVAQQLQECLTCALISPELTHLTAEKIQGADASIHVLHPSSMDQSVLRTSLLPGLLQVIKFNLDRQNENLHLFEVGHIHFKQKEHYYEQSAAAIALSGKRSPYHFESKEQEVDFFDLKGKIENILTKFGLQSAIFEAAHLHNFHPGRQARIKIENLCLGFLGEVHPQHLKKLGINRQVYFAELNLHDFYPHAFKYRHHFRVQAIPALPGSTRDWTITLPIDLPIARIFEHIHAASPPLLFHTELIDLYKSDKIGKDRKNATFRFTYRNINRTIEFEEVEQEHLRLTERIQEQLRGSL